MKSLYLPLLAVVLVLFAVGAQAQSLTTATISGSATSTTGEPLAGATVRALHVPSGSQYGALTSETGRFTLPNLRSGGPYTVTIDYVGFKQFTEEGIILSLGQNYPLKAKLSEANVTLEQVVIQATNDPILNNKRTGASTSISQANISSLPSLTRSLADYTRLTPQANQGGNGTSFAGSNNRFNSIMIDGAVNNDVFGLTQSGTPGGAQDSRRGVEPISLDAIDQIQVSIAPFDIRQGNFTGGAVNGITRSGTNDIEGSIYYFGRNAKMLGNLPNNNRTLAWQRPGPEYDIQYGFRIGAPIIKDKLFIFISGELQRYNRELTFNLGDPQRTAEQDQILRSLIARVENVLVNVNGGYRRGDGVQPISNVQQASKFFIRFDWNISQNHKLVLRTNYLNSDDKQFNSSRGATSYVFPDAGIRTPVIQTSTVAELRSTFGSKFANKLTINYQDVKDDRDPSGALFPRVVINNTVNSTNFAQYGLTAAPQINNQNYSITFGSEGPSQANRLTQQTWTITNDINYFAGDHTITLGTHNEFYHFQNLFLNGYAGNYTYNGGPGFATVGILGWENLTTYRPDQYSVTIPRTPDGNLPIASFDATQVGVYVQDEWVVNDKLTVIAGVRIDVPFIKGRPNANAEFNRFAQDIFIQTSDPEWNVRTETIPKSTILWSPRIGFNLDLFGDRKTQIRGGAGVFTGRLPFVWLSNQFTNNGITQQTVTPAAGATPFFSGDPRNQAALVTTPGTFPANTTINVVDNDFKFPQTFRASLAVDQVLPIWGIIAGIEVVYTKNINAPFYRDLNILTPSRRFDTPTIGGQGDTRWLYNTAGSGFRNQYSDTYTFNAPFPANAFGNVIRLGNTPGGYAYTLTGTLTKRLDKGFDFTAGYTYSRAESIQDGLNSIANSSWVATANVDGANSRELGWSQYALPHRVFVAASYRKEYAKNFATSIAFFYNAQSGPGISHVYRDDMNLDTRGATNGSELMYVPRDISEIRFATGLNAQDQWNQLNAFIEGNDYLRTRRGQYAERNADRAPWNKRLDIRLKQEFLFNVKGRPNRIEITLDINNFLALLNPDWGFQYAAAFFDGRTSVLRFRGNQTAGGRIVPTFEFQNQFDNRAWSLSSRASTYEMQAGIRYVWGR